MADIAVICDICQKKIAKHTCKNCGRRVCDDHYDAKSGWCTSCSKGRSGTTRHMPSFKK